MFSMYMQLHKRDCHLPIYSIRIAGLEL